MSEFLSEPPPPPPPPPPPAAPKPTFDFVKPFGFVFQDPKWVSKILIGGLFQLAAVFIIGIFFVLGYCARLTRNVIAGSESPLPEWDDLGDYFAEGLRLAAIVLIYSLPLIIFAFVAIIPAALMSTSNDQILNNLGGGMMAAMWCLMLPFSLLLAFYLPGALLFAITEQDFGAAFQVGRIFRFIGDNIGNYIIAFIIYLIARMAVPFGFILCCVGIVFVAFWAFLVGTYAFAQVYRFSKS